MDISVMGISVNAATLLLIVFIFASEDALATVTSSQDDIEVIVGGTASIACVTSLPKDMHWYHYPIGSNEQKYVYTYGMMRSPYLGRFEMRKDSPSGLFQLVISGVELTDAGVFSCQEDEGSGDAAQTQLTVLEAAPDCTSSKNPVEVIGPNSCNKEQENLTLACSVAYRGNIEPLLEWKKFGANDTVTQGVSVARMGNSIISRLTIFSQPALDGSSYICQTTKTRVNCTSGVINVIYVIGGNLTENMAIGDTVQCVANTNESCTYSWKWFKNKDVLTVSHNRTLIPKQAGNFRCEVECVIGKEPCIVIAMFAYVDGGNVSSSTGEPEPGSRNIVLIVVIIVFIIAATIVGFILLYHFKRQHQEKGNGKVLIHMEESERMFEEKTSFTSIGEVQEYFSKLQYLDRGTSGEINGPFTFRENKCVCQRIMCSSSKVVSATEDELRGRRWMSLDHRNVLRFYDILFTHPALYVVMEYAEGTSVRNALNLCTEDLEVSIVKDWAKQIADGMNYLHSEEIIHRHLRAEQVLIMEPFHPTDPLPKSLKIASYRLTTDSGQSVPMSSSGTTYAWMAPEVTRAFPTSKASDVWSYGITVWEILTRQIPYKNSKSVEILQKVKEGTGTLSVPDRCPKTIQELFKGCWERDVDRRSTFSDILSLLQKENDVLYNNIPDC